MSGTLEGIVYDASTREPLPGANIVVLGTTLGTASDLAGEFRLRAVPVGSYSVKASVVGYQSMIKSDIIISTGKPQRIEFELREAPIELGEITVTASYFSRSPDKPVSVQTQSYEEIRRLPGGFEDVVRAVSILPGVAQAQPGRNDLIVRGGAPSENLYVVDNLQIPNINHFGTQGASGGPLSYLNLDYVSETQFSSGGFGARYGDRLSSVLTITMKDGREDRLGGKATISATQFGLNLEGPLDAAGSFLVSARRSYLDFIFRAAGFSFVPEYWDFLGKATYRLSSSDQVSFLAVGAIDRVRTFSDTPEQVQDNSRVLLSNQNQAAGGLTWRHLFEHGFTRVTLSQTYVDYAYEQRNTSLEPIFTNISSEYETLLAADVLYQLSPATELSAGIQGKATKFKADLYLPPFRTSFGEVLSVDAIYDTLALKGGAFIQISQRLGRYQMTLGGRVDFFNLISHPVVFSPRLSVSYALTGVTNINVSVGQYHQAPSYVWLVSYPENRYLRFIRADQIVLGIDHLLRDDLKISLEGYYKRYSHYPASLTRPYLVLANTGAGYGGSDEGFASFGVDPLASEGTGVVRGAELFLQKKSSQVPGYGLVSLSYCVSAYTPLNGISRPGSFDQRWIVNLGGGYQIGNFWALSSKFRLYTGRPFTPYNPDGTQDPSLYNTSRVVTNHSLDLRLERRFMFPSWMLLVFLDVQNVYNRKPVDAPRYNYATGQIETTASIGILPSVGISAEF